MSTPHMHKDVIIAWAQGKPIEQRNHHKEPWQKAPATPSWSCQKYYRIKPEPKILHGFIDALMLEDTKNPYAVFRPNKLTSNAIPCTLTFFPDA